MVQRHSGMRLPGSLPGADTGNRTASGLLGYFPHNVPLPIQCTLVGGGGDTKYVIGRLLIIIMESESK